MIQRSGVLYPEHADRPLGCDWSLTGGWGRMCHEPDLTIMQSRGPSSRWKTYVFSEVLWFFQNLNKWNVTVYPWTFYIKDLPDITLFTWILCRLECVKQFGHFKQNGMNIYILWNSAKERGKVFLVRLIRLNKSWDEVLQRYACEYCCK